MDQAAFLSPVAAAATPSDFAPAGVAGLRAEWLVALLVGWLAVDQVLLWRFLGLIPGWAAVLLCAGTAGAAVVAARVPFMAAATIRPRVLLAAAAAALLIYLLGGEGRLFYAGTDWQVRNAVLRDLALNPWPFAYDVDGGLQLLRAPLGMYLVPALAGGIGGQYGAELALLAQNTLLLAALFGLGSLLFRTGRAQLSALAIFILFSGMDAIGQMLAGQPLQMSPERWNLAVFSAHITQAFCVPQHALAGWTGALLYLLWREERIALAAALAPLPLLALWSPLGLLGALPFAAHAGISTLCQRRLRLGDVVLPAASCALALPGLIYMSAGSDAVQRSAANLPFHQYVAFEALEVGPYLLGWWFIGRGGRAFGTATFLCAAVILLVVPFGQIAQSSDFVGRVSAAALAVLALAVAHALTQPWDARGAMWRRILIGALAIGAVTPAFEVWRAIAWPRSPEVRCSYFGVVPGGYATYTVRLDAVSRTVAPREPVRVHPQDPAQCWSGEWPERPLYPNEVR